MRSPGTPDAEERKRPASLSQVKNRNQRDGRMRYCRPLRRRGVLPLRSPRAPDAEERGRSASLLQGGHGHE